MVGQTPEVYFRNPHNYIRELVECSEYKIAWDKGLLVTRSIDPIKFVELHYSTSMPWEILVVNPAGTAEYHYGDTENKPSAVYPTWSYQDDDPALLMEILEKPVGEDPDVFNAKDCLGSERPVEGQPHKVIITDMPLASTGPGKRFLVYIKELQEDFPDATIHVHGLYGYRPAFGLGFQSVDVEPRTSAQKGKILLPSGKEINYEAAFMMPQWIKLLGLNPADLSVPRNRCIYNIKSAKWAAENYDRLYVFRQNKNAQPVDFGTPTNQLPIASSTSSPVSRILQPQDGDKFLCNTCSLQDNCTYFRDGAVCALPGAEPTSLSKMFRSRDADTIVDGLGAVLGAQASRVETGLQLEEAYGEQSSLVSKDLNALFGNGVKLAKLLNPALAGGPKVQINVGAGGAVQMATPQNLVARIVSELEARGIPRNQITPEMIQGTLEGMATEATARRAIQGTVLARADEPIEEQAS